MKIKSKDFCVPEGERVDLKKWPTNNANDFASALMTRKRTCNYGWAQHLSCLQYYPRSSGRRRRQL